MSALPSIEDKQAAGSERRNLTASGTGRGRTGECVPNQHLNQRSIPMPQGDKSAYTDKQKRQAEHIEEGYEKRGVPEAEAVGRAWATVNKISGGGKKSGSGRGKPENKAPSKAGG